MKIFTSLQLLFCLITLTLSLPRHIRDIDSNKENVESETKLKESNLPKVEASDDLPKLEVSDLPKIEESDLPKIEKSDLPKLEVSDLPKLGVSDLPKVKESDLPKVEESDLPKVEGSDLPKVEESDLPKLEVSKELQEKPLTATETALENSNETKNLKQFNYASLQSQIIATNILKDNIKNRSNEVFSPLGISTILAILAEGSQGDTYKEFEDALGYPSDKTLLRESFNNVLEAYKKIDYDINPSFKTWFYIYRNNTAKDNFKEILKTYYNVEVKEIDNNDFDWDEPKTSPDEEMNENDLRQITNLKRGTISNVTPSISASEEQSSNSDQSQLNDKNNSKDIIGFEDLKKSNFIDEKHSEIVESDTKQLLLPTSSSVAQNSEVKEIKQSEKDIAKDTPKEDNNSNTVEKIIIKETNKINDPNKIEEIFVIEKEASKFDAVVDDKQYVEVPVIKAEIAKEMEEKRNREEKESVIEQESEEKKNSSPPVLQLETTLPREKSKEEEENLKKEIQAVKEAEANVEANIVDAVIKEIRAEKLALDDYLQEANNEEIKSDITEAKSDGINELKKEEELIESVILQKELNSKQTNLPIEIPLENSDSSQIRRIELIDINDEENETISQDEKIDNLRKHNKPDGIESDDIETVVFVESKEPEKITLSIKKFDDENGEIMEAVETSFTKRKIEPRSLLKKDDIASALSANSISGRENPSKTKMLLFNGLYYRGNWAHPFMELRCDSMESFTSYDGKSIPSRIMTTRGSFRMAKLESLDADALELPYENERFSFVIIVPKQKDGLERLIEKIQPVDLQMLQTRLTDTLTTINLPKFEIEQTSRSEKTMKRLGINKIFSAYTSNMSDLSDESGLHVDEVVQHVNLRVDEGAASANALSASNTLGRSILESKKGDEDDKHFDVNRPFLYFIIDRSSNFIIVAGKLLEPQIKEEFGFES